MTKNCGSNDQVYLLKVAQVCGSSDGDDGALLMVDKAQRNPAKDRQKNGGQDKGLRSFWVLVCCTVLKLEFFDQLINLEYEGHCPKFLVARAVWEAVGTEIRVQG